MVRISAVVISSSAAKSFFVHMALVLASQFSTAACSSVRGAGAGLAGAEQAVTARLITAASETAAARVLPVWFISAVPSCRVLVPTLGIPAARGIGPLPGCVPGGPGKTLGAGPDVSG